MKSLKKGLHLFLAVSILFTVGIIGIQSNQNPVCGASLAVPPPAAVNQVFPDPALADVVATALGKQTTDTITQTELNLIVNFVVFDEPISNISGVEYMTGLRNLDMSRNSITDISALASANFTRLETLNLAAQYIEYPLRTWESTITLTNSITNIDDSLLAPNTISNGGTYTAPTVTWNMTNPLPELTYTFTTPVTVGSVALGPINGTYSGTIAQPLEITYPLKFFVDGQLYEERDLYEGDIIIIPIEPEKTGYTFIGWNTEDDGSGDVWNFNNGIMPGSELNLYAQWIKDKVIIVPGDCDNSDIEVNVSGNAKDKASQLPQTGNGLVSLMILSFLLITAGSSFVLLNIKNKHTSN